MEVMECSISTECATDRGRGGDVTLQVHVEVTWNSFYLPCRKLVANVVSQLPRTLFDQTWLSALQFRHLNAKKSQLNL